MPTPFDDLGYTEATQAVNRAAAAAPLTGIQLTPFTGQRVADSTPRPVFSTSAAYIVRSMLEGDHWLNGIGWIGPRPESNAEGAAETMMLLQAGFISQNAIGEVIARHVAGVLGKDPHWSLSPRRALKADESPTTEEQTLIDEAEAALTEWWDTRKIHRVLQEATKTLLYARRAPCRLFVPRGKLRSTNITDDTGRTRTVKVVDADDVRDGLTKIYPDNPLPEKAAVVEDPDTRESIGVVLYSRGQSITGTGSPQEVAELTYLSEPNAGGPALTIIRQAGQNERGFGVGVRLNLGERLTMHEMSRDAFVTSQMFQLQRALNLSLSALPRNVITGGWLERVITNAQMPGKFVADSTKPNGKRWVPDRHVTGAGSTTYLKGLRTVDANGADVYANPGIQWRPPTEVTPTVEAQEALYRGILREAKQEHALMTQSVNASGKSREQARADFEMTLQPTAAEVNTLGRWLLETALAMAEAFAETPGRYTNTLRAVFECVIDSGPITADERTALDGSVQAGTLSRQTAMARGGVLDVAAELARIQSDPKAELDAIKVRADAFAVLVGQGADIEGAALAVGFDDDVAESLTPVLEDPPEDDPADDPEADPEDPPPARQSRRQRQRAAKKPATGPS